MRAVNADSEHAELEQEEEEEDELCITRPQQKEDRQLYQKYKLWES